MSPIKLAIVGGGPSAFYVASRLLNYLHTATTVAAAVKDTRIHIYDRLWSPYGLVRYGVAPDHPEVKNCTHSFDLTASDSRVHFFGNVNIGVCPAPFPSTEVPTSSLGQPDTSSIQPHALLLPLDVLFPYYTHLVFATGAPLPRLHPLLPPSSFCIPAPDIVHWYTMHPSSPSSYTFRSPIPPGTRHITLIGHGNVALDIARMLLTPPSQLATLDIPAHVLRTLEDLWGTLKQISIVGRKGPQQVKFTAKEVREMMDLKEASMWAIPEGLFKAVEKRGLSRSQERVINLLKNGSKNSPSSKLDKTFSIEFWRSPKGYTVLPASEQAARVELRLEETELVDTTQQAVGTGKVESMRTDLIVTSLGYEGDAALLKPDGANESSGKFPWYSVENGRMRTQGRGGRLLTADGEVVPNVYASGWAGQGATGKLAGTLVDATNVAAAIMNDLREGGEGGTAGLFARDGDVAGGMEGVPPAVMTGVQEGQVMLFETWRKVDEEERRRGGGMKERERMQWEDVRKYLKQGPAPGVSVQAEKKS